MFTFAQVLHPGRSLLGERALCDRSPVRGFLRNAFTRSARAPGVSFNSARCDGRETHAPGTCRISSPRVSMGLGYSLTRAMRTAPTADNGNASPFLTVGATDATIEASHGF